MGKSSGAKQVNSNLNDQYAQLNAPTSQLNQLATGQQDWMKQQQDNQTGLFNNMIGGFGGLGSDTGNLMGQGVFSDMAHTGGFTPQQSENYMKQATSEIPAMFAGISDRMANQNTINHGNNPGYNAQMQKLTRDQAQGGQAAELAGQNSLASMINQNKMAGAGGLQRGAEAQNQFALGKQGLANQMYGMGQQGSNMAFGNILQALGMKQADIDSILQQQGARNPNQSAFTKFLSPILGAGGSILGGLAGGIGGGSNANANNTSAYGPVNYGGGQY